MLLGFSERSRCAFASGLAAIVMHLAWSVGFWSSLANMAAVGSCRKQFIEESVQ
jgi:hypothetical protein